MQAVRAHSPQRQQQQAPTAILRQGSGKQSGGNIVRGHSISPAGLDAAIMRY